MYFRMAKRLLLETDKRLVWKLFWNAGMKGYRSIRKHKQRLKKGEFFPPFLYISIINSCNLRCQGCWVDVAAKQSKIELEAMNRLIDEAKEMGNSFFGILGGEPFMHAEMLDIIEQHPDAYFQVFTNGHFITEAVAKRMRRLGNVTPLISVEGDEIISDERRGKGDVFGELALFDNAPRMATVVAVTPAVCNIISREEFQKRLQEMDPVMRGITTLLVRRVRRLTDAVVSRKKDS